MYVYTVDPITSTNTIMPSSCTSDSLVSHSVCVHMCTDLLCKHSVLIWPTIGPSHVPFTHFSKSQPSYPWTLVYVRTYFHYYGHDCLQIIILWIVTLASNASHISKPVCRRRSTCLSWFQCTPMWTRLSEITWNWWWTLLGMRHKLWVFL